MNNDIRLNELAIGDVFNITSGGTITILEIVNYSSIKVRHNDDYGYVTVTRLSHIKSGNVFNPYNPSVRNRGYIGVGKYQSNINGKNTKEYDAWSHMFTRCYSEIYHSKYPTYIDCEVDEVWWNFQVFAEWYCNTGYYNTDYQLDKDLIVYGNKVYSPEACCVIPIDINIAIQDKKSNRTLPTGVYKRGNKYIVQVNSTLFKAYIGSFNTIEEASSQYVKCKQNHILYLASTWRDKISPLAHASLVKYVTYL